MNVKLTDEQFLEALRENYGNITKTVIIIKEKHGIDITRQAVHKRAQNFIEDLKDIREQMIDMAEANFMKLVCQSDDLKIQYKASEFILNHLGGLRGYGKNGNDRILNQEPEGYFEIGGKEFRF